MIKDKDGLWFVNAQVWGTKIQLRVTIPKADWKFYPVLSRVKLISRKGVAISRKVKQMSEAQRAVNIPTDDMDIFKKGEIIKIYPEKQPKIKSQSINNNADNPIKQEVNNTNGKPILPQSSMS